jgi:hypothetical protein
MGQATMTCRRRIRQVMLRLLRLLLRGRRLLGLLRLIYRRDGLRWRVIGR